MIELLSSVSWWPVGIATVIYFVLGALWYSPLLFAKPWMNAMGMTDEPEGAGPLLFFFSFVLQFVGVLSLALFMEALDITSAATGALIGFYTAAGFLFSLAGATGLFSETPLKLHVINYGYHVAGLTLAGLILGAWG